MQSRAQRLFHRGETSFLNFLLGHHIDGLRGIEQRRLQARIPPSLRLG